MKSFLLYFCFLILSLNYSLSSFQTLFFQQINKEFINKNLIISPLSAYQVLSLTSNGAKGKTLQEMLLALSSSSLNELNEVNIAILNAAKELNSLEIANAVMTSFIPEEKFSEIAYKYESTIEALKDVDQVNYWCKVKTHEKIKKILDSIEPNTMMILLNAVYFKGTWTKKFDPNYTQQSNFYNFGEEINAVSIDMMFIKEKFNYYEDELSQVIDLVTQKVKLKENQSIDILINDVGEILGDRSAIEKMLTIFIDNGIKYSGEDGKVRIYSRREKHFMKVSIEDNGVGIAKEHHEKIFERFYRVDSSRTKLTEGVISTGLGLSIAKWIADQHDIKIDLDSEIGKGTKITLSIPLAVNKLMSGDNNNSTGKVIHNVETVEKELNPITLKILEN